jgi:hypothetical protein
MFVFVYVVMQVLLLLMLMHQCVAGASVGIPKETWKPVNLRKEVSVSCERGSGVSEVVARRKLHGAEDAFMLDLDLELPTHFNLPPERVLVSAFISLLPPLSHCLHLGQPVLLPFPRLPLHLWLALDMLATPLVQASRTGAGSR